MIARARWPGWLAFCVPLAVYALSAYRSPGFWDVGEMDVVPWILGIAHPTGFPAFTVLGFLFTHLLPFGTVAWRMSIFSALGMSTAAWCIYRIVDDSCDAPWIGAACAWCFAFGEIAWTRATRAEVHALAIAAIAVTLLCALRWYRTSDSRYLLAGAGAWGVGMAVHPVAVLLFPALFVVLLARMHDVSSRRLLMAIGLCALIVAGFYAYLPLRSAYVGAHRLDPTRALGLPAGRPFWDYDQPSTVHGFIKLVTGSGLGVGEGVRSIVDPQVYEKRGGLYLAAVWQELTPIGIALALLGIIVALRRDRVRASVLLLAGFPSVPFALGFTQEADFRRYFLSSFLICAIFIGEGIGMLCMGRLRLRRWAAIGLALLAATLLISERSLFAQPYDNRASRAVDRVLQLTPHNAILVAAWTYATPLAYAAYVEDRLGGRTLDAAWLGNDAAYIPGWLRRRPVYVVGLPEGSLPGYRLEAVASMPPLYRVVKRP
ncbi:MAG: protein O-mannosyl-transferase family [Vulcanimicrobiaceae bacterium]